MSDPLFIALSSFFLALSGAIMPGPLFAVTVSETPRRGWITGPLLVAGHGTLELCLISLIISGQGSFLRMKETFVALAIIGGLFLLFMAFSTFRSIKSISLKSENSRNILGSLFLSGIILSIANPYWLLWWMTIGINYLIQSIEVGNTGILAFFLGHILGDFLWYSAISIGIYKSMRLLKDSMYRKLVLICNFIILGFSFYFIYVGVDGIRNLL